MQSFGTFLLAAVNAKYIHSNPAIYSLRAYAGEKHSSRILLAEYTINQQVQDILADLYSKKPSVIGFSCYIWNWKIIQELLLELPKVLPETEIFLGGPQVSFDAPELLRQFPQLTGIIIGEGEQTFRELMDYYGEGKVSLSDIAGLCLREGYTAPRELLDMDELPFYYNDMASFANRIVYYESSRGCPYGCSYCLSSIDKSVRFRSVEKVKRELAFFLAQRIDQVKFVDRTFNCDHKRTLELWQFLKEHDNGVTNFHFEIAANLLQEEEIALLQSLRPGLVQLEIGVQSVNPRTLHAINRVMDVDKLSEIVGAVGAGENVHRHLDLIAGLPFEDYESFAHSFDRVYAMKPEQLQLGFLKVLKGSPMEAKAKDYGLRYLSTPPYEVLCTDWLTYEEVLRLKRVEEMVEIYYNSGQFTHTLRLLEKAFSSPFALFETLGEFYEEKGYVTNQPARAYRYQVLLDFACTYDSGKEEIYKELLLYDMYLRENLKSRPDWAPAVTEEQKAFNRQFYKTEERRREALPGYEGYDAKQLGKMTHMEYFSYPVWDIEEVQNQSKAKRGAYLLFDYKRKDLLTGDAFVQIIEADSSPQGTVMMDSYVCIDLETTGLNPKTDRIIEIGMVKVIQGKITDTFQSFVNPGRQLEQRIVELTGITDRELADAPAIGKLLPRVQDFLGELPLLGHSVLFDYSFLKKAMTDEKYTFEKNGVDTLKIARRYLDKLEHRSLDFLCGYYGIAHTSHRALEDACATVALYEKLTADFGKEKDDLFEPKPLVFHVKRDTPATKPQKERLYRLLEKHRIDLGIDVESLTRSEASRFTDKILSGCLR